MFNSKDLSYTQQEFIKEFLERINKDGVESTADWAWSFIVYAKQMSGEYQERSSWPLPEASEVLGENREKKMVVTFLQSRMRSSDISLCAAAYEEAAMAISQDEHH